MYSGLLTRVAKSARRGRLGCWSLKLQNKPQHNPETYGRCRIFHATTRSAGDGMQKEAKADAAILRYADKKTGEFKRAASSFRHWVTEDGSSGFKAEPGRYHLYVSYACPWAHRTLVARKLKGLEDVISFDVVDYCMGEKGWRFNPDVPGATADSVNGFNHIRELYFKVEPEYSGRFTVPVLYDKVKKTIVNNESSEILRMLNSAFNAFCKLPEQAAIDLYPEALRAEIDALNEWIYP